MPWRDLGTKDRWQLVASALQAVATVGTFFAAVVGIWKVTPIITYQVQQQEAQAERVAQAVMPTTLLGEAVTDRFVDDAVRWWSGEVASHQRILDLTGGGLRDRKVTFELIAAGATAVAPGVVPDLLVVTATGPGSASETVKVTVNEHAMSPSQYLQRRVNQGFFAELDAATRTKVEVALQRYIYRQMVPRVPPVHVQPTMSLKQLHDEIALDQSQRVETLQHLLGLKAMLEGVIRE
jgi:hypothetical protein